MKKLFLLCVLALALPTAALAAEDEKHQKIDPPTYICAELSAQLSTSQVPPIFESLQIDGYAAADGGIPLADPSSLGAIVLRVGEICQEHPTYNVLPLWQEARRGVLLNESLAWNPETTTCAQFKAKEATEGNSFIIWLDGYHRRNADTDKSILADDAIFQKFTEACAKEPDSLMLDVMHKVLQ